jgi:hypothetical protein
VAIEAAQQRVGGDEYGNENRNIVSRIREREGPGSSVVTSIYNCCLINCSLEI